MKCVDQLLPLITAIINRSMDESVMPSCLKRPTITPLLTRYGLFKEYMKANVLFQAFLSSSNSLKRQFEHLEHNDINDSYLSGYRGDNSTETALLKVYCDITEAFDEASITALIMLNLSAAFDVIDHPILLKYLEFSFGINLSK